MTAHRLWGGPSFDGAEMKTWPLKLIREVSAMAAPMPVKLFCETVFL